MGGKRKEAFQLGVMINACMSSIWQEDLSFLDQLGLHSKTLSQNPKGGWSDDLALKTLLEDLGSISSSSSSSIGFNALF